MTLSFVRRGACAGAALAALLAAPSIAAGNYGFKVAITLSPKASVLLKTKREDITVSAMYSGDPSPAGKRHADEEGQVDLGSEEVTIPGANGVATITGIKFETEHLAWVTKPQVLLNIYSARHSDPNNLLDCGIFQDDVAKAQAQPVQIACKVIGEP